MNIKEFSDASPGRLVPVTTAWGQDHAFVPHALPPVWEFPTLLWPLLADVKAEIALLEGIGRGLPNPDLLLKPLSGIEAIESSALEGTYATPQELLLFELHEQSTTSDDEQTNRHREVANYRQALQYGTSIEQPLSLRLLCEMHEMLMRGVRGEEKTPGQFRQQQVGIGVGGRFIPPPHFSLKDCLDPLELYLQNPSNTYDPLIACYLVHYQFETIHPFNDGNGRVGRLLLAIMLQQWCKLSKPWLYMSNFFNQHREEYVQHLFNISAKGDWTAWIAFCLRGTLEQAKDTIVRCERLKEIKEIFLQRLQDSGGAARLIQIVDRVFDSPFVDISDIKEQLGVSDPTARADAQRLVDIGILEELAHVWPKTYYAPEVFRIAYEKIE
ncbi:MAG: Fic family protein [Planctomycetes bacterium]|nr:Fic family protein [Planctomycetota bacterium]